MTNEQKTVLLRCVELTDALPTSEPKPWEFGRLEWEEQMDLGPRYLASRWFGPINERMRMRYRRAVDVLESQGLVETHRAWGTRLTHLRATDKGRAVVDRIRIEAASDG